MLHLVGLTRHFMLRIHGHTNIKSRVVVNFVVFLILSVTSDVAIG